MTENQKIDLERKRERERKHFAHLDRLREANQAAVDDPQGWIDGLLETEEILG